MLKIIPKFLSSKDFKLIGARGVSGFSADPAGRADIAGSIMTEIKNPTPLNPTRLKAATGPAKSHTAPTAGGPMTWPERITAPNLAAYLVRPCMT